MGQHVTIHAKTTENFNGMDGKWTPVRMNSDGSLFVYETAPAGYDQQQLALTTIDPPSRQVIAAGSTDTVLAQSGLGAIGDYISHLIVVVATAATAQVQIKDGSGTAVTVFPNSPGGGIGTYTIPSLGASLAGAWKITTGAGVSVIARGRF